MPRVIITEKAAQGLEACRRFLTSKGRQVSLRAGQVIESQFALLEKEPLIGRPYGDIPELRELTIPFGDSGYVSLYRYEASFDSVSVLAFRHQKETGYEKS